MKRPRTKFAKQPFMFQGGGLMDFLGKKGTGDFTMGQGIGAGLDLATGFLGNKQSDSLLPTNSYSEDAAANYNKVVAKNQKTKGMISGGLNTAGNIAMNFNPVIGLGLKGLGAVTKMFNFGKKKEDAAKRDFTMMDQAGNQMQMAKQGAINYNSNNAGYRAPAYGKKGLKFKTKFSRA